MSKHFKIVVAVIILFFASFFLLDKIPHNRFYKHPNIYSQEYFERFQAEKKAEIELKWTYEHFEGVRSPAISPDGKYVAFITTVEKKRSLMAMDAQGSKLWHSPVDSDLYKDQAVKVFANLDSVVLHWTDRMEDSVKDEEQTKVFYFDPAGTLRWTQNAWGKVFIQSTTPVLFLSRYTNRHLFGWEEKEPSLPKTCLDPEIRNFGGGDVLAYDERGRLSEIDPTTGIILKDHAVIGVETISPNYIIASCIDKTDIYSKSFERIASIPGSGYVTISPDEKYTVIRAPNRESEQQDQIAVYDMRGVLQWEKSVLSYAPNIIESEDGAHGVIALRGGYIGILSAQYGRHLSEYLNVELTLFDSKGNIVWSKNAINEKPLNLVLADASGSGLIVATKMKFDTEWWPNTKLSEVFQYFGILGTPTHNYKQEIHFVDIHGQATTSSSEIISERFFRSMKVDETNKHIIAAGDKLYFFDVAYH